MRILRESLWFWILVLLAPAVALAQPAAARPPPPLPDLVKPGDRLFVTYPTGVEVEGRLLRVSPEELVLLVGNDEHAFRRERIGRIEKRDSLWNGLLVGAVPGALIGAAGGAFECDPHCGHNVATGALVVGAIGGGVGVLVDFVAKGYAPVDGPSVGSPNAFRVPGPVASIEDLWQRVRQGDTIDVVTLDGRKVHGTFVEVSAEAVTIAVDGERREIPARDVSRVTRRGNRFRRGAFWGAMFMAAMGGVAGGASCSSGSGSCSNPALLAVYMAMPGALWGTVIGAVIPRHAVVYEPGASAELHLGPMLGPGRVGVVFSAKF